MRVRRQVYARILIKDASQRRKTDLSPLPKNGILLAKENNSFCLVPLMFSRFFLVLFLTNFWSTFGSLLYLQLPDHFSEARGEQVKTTRIKVTFPGRLSKVDSYEVDSYDSDIKGTFQS